MNLERFRQLSVQLPSLVKDKPVIASPDKAKDSEGANSKEALALALLGKHRMLTAAALELRDIDATHLQAHNVVAHPGTVVDDNLTSTSILAHQLKHKIALSSLNLQQLSSSTHPLKPDLLDTGVLEDAAGGTSAVNLSKVLLAPARGLVPQGPWTPEKYGDYGLRLKSTAMNALSADTLSIMQSEVINLVSTPLNRKSQVAVLYLYLARDLLGKPYKSLCPVYLRQGPSMGLRGVNSS